MSKDSEMGLQEFLAPLPAWLRRTLEKDFPSLTQAEILEWAKSFDEVFRLTAEYERILEHIPVRWREYRERRKREARRTAQYEAQFLVSKGKPGRPPKDELATEAMRLQQCGMKFPQIAGELNKKLGNDNKTTADAIRQLLKRCSHPDET